MRVLIALALCATATAFTPSSFGARSRAAALRANIVETLVALKGPNIVWGYDGPANGHEEAEIRGQDTFNTLIAAVTAAGLAPTLSGPGPFTVFAPTDSAFARLPKGTVEALLKDIPALTKILTYHVVPGTVTFEQINGDLKTVNGKELKYKRFSRKTFLDNAWVGQKGEGAATGSVFPTNVAASNGIIHVIDDVLLPQ